MSANVPSLCEWLHQVLEPLMRSPKLISINQAGRGPKVLVEIQVDEDDVGRLVGREGRMIRSLRELVNAYGARHGVSVILNLPQARPGPRRCGS
jgi:hypothetical protein